MGDMIYEEYDELDEKNAQRKLFFDSQHKPLSNENNKKMMAGYMKVWDRFDANKDGKLNKHEWMKMNRFINKATVKLFGGKGPEWTVGDYDFFWTMTDAVSDGRWNRNHR